MPWPPLNPFLALYGRRAGQRSGFRWHSVLTRRIRDYKIVPTYKGNYEQSLAAGIAAVRSGKAPAVLQVYEVGTATMMA